MDSTKPVPDQPTYEVAGFTDRVFARAVDGFLMSCILLVTGIPVAFIFLFTMFRGDDGAAFLYVLMWVAVLAPAVLYEVHPTARRGYMAGKGPAGTDLLVIRWSAFNGPGSLQRFPSYGQSFVRWLVPHGVLLAGVVVSVLLWAGSADLNPLVWFIGPVGWFLIYLTSLLDKNGRGWHDKAAGTVVVKAPRTAPSE